MAEQMLIGELLTGDCGDECKGPLKEKLKKKLWIVIPAFLVTSLIISLCISVSVLHEKQSNQSVDCVLKPTFKKDILTACPHVDQYPLTNEIYVRICVNDNIQVDIRRYYNRIPGKEGITLSQMQWQYLKQSAPHMDKSILKSQKHIK